MARKLYAIIAGVFVLGLLIGGVVGHSTSTTTTVAASQTATSLAVAGTYPSTTQPYSPATTNFTDRLFTTTAAPAGTNPAGTSNQILYDLNITACKPTTSDAVLLGPEIDFTFVNRSASTYSFDFVFSIDTLGGGQQLDTVPAHIESLAPGQSNVGKVYSQRSSIKGSNIECRRGQVTAVPA